MEGLEEQWKKACADYREAADRKYCLYQEIQEAIRKESLKEWKTRHGLDTVVGINPTTTGYLRNHIANGRIRTKDGEIIRVEWFKHGFYFEVDDNRISASYEAVWSNNKREREVAEELLPEVNHVKEVIEDLDAIATEKRAKFEMK